MIFEFIFDMAFLLVCGFVIGGLYFVFTDETAPLARRVISSAHGPCIALFFMIVRCLLMGRPLQFEKFTGLLLCFQILPAALIIYSLVRYPGPKALHLVLLLIIPAWFWLVVGGFLLLHGE